MSDDIKTEDLGGLDSPLPPVVHAAMWRGGLQGTLCGLTRADGAWVATTTVTDETTCKSCRAKIDGEHVQVQGGDDVRLEGNHFVGSGIPWPGDVEIADLIGADERTQALNDAKALLTGRVYTTSDLLTVAEYILNGPGGYLILKRLLDG